MLQVDAEVNPTDAVIDNQTEKSPEVNYPTHLSPDSSIPASSRPKSVVEELEHRLAGGANRTDSSAKKSNVGVSEPSPEKRPVTPTLPVTADKQRPVTPTQGLPVTADKDKQPVDAIINDNKLMKRRSASPIRQLVLPAPQVKPVSNVVARDIDIDAVPDDSPTPTGEQEVDTSGNIFLQIDPTVKKKTPSASPNRSGQHSRNSPSGNEFVYISTF